MEKICFWSAQLIKGIGGGENSCPNLMEVKPGKTIVGPVKSTSQLYFSLKGVVKLNRIKGTGKEIAMVLLPEQSWFGLLPMLSGKSAPEYQAVAFTPVTLISMSRGQFQQELKKSPQLGRLITQQLSARLLTAEMMIESRLRKTLSARLVSFLLILARDFGVATDGRIKIDLPLSHQTLAGLINSNRVSVTRVLGQLQQQQMISRQQQKITLHNPSALSQYVDWTEFFPLNQPPEIQVGRFDRLGS